MFCFPFSSQRSACDQHAGAQESDPHQERESDAHVQHHQRQRGDQAEVGQAPWLGETPLPFCTVSCAVFCSRGNFKEILTPFKGDKLALKPPRDSIITLDTCKRTRTRTAAPLRNVEPRRYRAAFCMNPCLHMDHMHRLNCFQNVFPFILRVSLCVLGISACLFE